MKKYVKAGTSGDLLLTSRGGNFKLYTESGIGMHNTPWTGFKVVRSKLADKHVVDVRVDTQWADLNGEPVEYQPRACYVAYGMRSTRGTVADIQTFIRLLEEAIEFKYEIDDYFSDVPGYTAED